MDICSLPPLPSLSLSALASAFGAAVVGVHLVSRLIVIFTHTPMQGSRWAKVYDVIEKAALEVGYAKETGLIQPSPERYETLLKQAGELLDHVGTK
jgi:hypothetical protein